MDTAEKSGSQGFWPLEREASAGAHGDASLGRLLCLRSLPSVRPQPSSQRKAWVTLGVGRASSLEEGPAMGWGGGGGDRQRKAEDELAAAPTPVPPTSSQGGPPSTRSS